MKKVMCMGLIGILAFGNASYVLAQENPTAVQVKAEKQTKEVKTSVNVKTKEVKYKNEAIDVNIKIPVVEGMKDKAIQKKINDMLEEDISEFKEELEKTANKDFKDFKEQGWKMNPYVIQVDYKVNSNKDNVLSISVTYYQYTGGAHGNTVQKNSNIDLDTGNEATLKDFFYEGENYKEVISKEIKKQIEAQKDKYFDEAFNVVSSISNKQPFYVKDGNIIVCYGHYEIAPYVAGIQEFKIPFSSFKKGVKKDIDVKYAQVKVGSKTIRKNDEVFISDLRIPVIRRLEDTRLQSKLNSDFEKDTMSFNTEIEKKARQWGKEAKKQGEEIHPYDAAADFKVNYNDNNLLSISVDYYEYTGGAHGNYEKKTKNIDLKTGKELALKDLFKDGVEYKDVINKEIKIQIQDAAKQMKKEMEQEGVKYKDENAPYKDFNGISDKQSFYIEDGNIIVYFGVYEIGSYVDGISEFRIPISQVKGNIKTEFLGF
ncbi:PdaC/SigV domain-containing protein [Clostridium sp. ZS2-4]|uniref:PdaC/SigV domain-containing protein n=1 Tax=Clostridium sp. ZS2-4 TaxID=2987703 RepID=UPI00227CF3F8|nr:DUF4163 domain-containing protein [Clostridium sp. ZS2-4]MCY6355570.1 DUF4163 domain-containing protein [Clostridium sp. ZS2-4]